jgi:phage gpG-like protein
LAARSKRVQKKGGKTLVDTGDLLSSVRNVVRPNEVEVGVDNLNKDPRVAQALQFGSHRQAVVVAHQRTITSAFGVPIPTRTINVRAHGMITNLPARPFIGVDDVDRRDLNEAWLDHLKGLLK